MRIEFVPVDTQAGATAALAVLAHEGAALSPEAKAANEATAEAAADAESTTTLSINSRAMPRIAGCKTSR